jgi:uncharacterized protein (TIGR03437 family)
MTLRKTLAITLAIAAICCFSVSDKLVAATVPDTGAIITYTASGTFATPQTSGADTLKLAGESFSVSIAVSSSTPPFKHGPNWGAYDKLKLTGTVHSGLLGQTPVNIASDEASIIQALDPGKYDIFTMEAPVRVVGISLIIKAVVIMPWGTLPKNFLLHPFTGPVSMVPNNATVTYSQNTNATVLAVAKGTLTATVPGGGTDAKPEAVLLHTGGARAVTLHGDGTESVRPLGAAPIDLGAAADAVTLKFYASGVSQASEVHVQIAGEEVPVVYAGRSGYYPGLDEVMVQVPRRLAGRGATSVTLTADGQTADPVRIEIQ